MLTTSKSIQPSTVLESASINTPPSVLTQGMTKKEWEIFYRLLVDLFTDNPKRKELSEKKGQITDESVSQRTGDRSAKSNHRQAATNY